MSGLPAVLVLIHKLGVGGLTRAVLDQTAMFTELGHETTILTLDPGGEQRPRLQRLRDQQQIRPEVAVRNIHQESRVAWAGVETGEVVHAPAWTSLDAVTDLYREDGADNKSVYSRYFDPYGGYVALVRRHPTGSIWRIDTYRDRAVVSSEMFGLDSELISIAEMAGGAPVVEQWLSPAGTPYLSRLVPGKLRRGRVTARLPGPGGQPVVTTFGSVLSWQMAWLQGIVDSHEQPPVVLAESPGTIPKAGQLRPGSAVRIGMLHNNQFVEPFRRGAAVRTDQRPALDAVADVDGMVVLTEDQRADVVDLVGEPDRWHVVPNSTTIRDGEAAAPEPGLVVLVTRLDPLKAIHETIHAFVRVRQQVPNARLEIYGSGPATSALTALVTELGLDDAVALMGRTDDPAGALARASATTLTSTREAMPLAILEAHANATPVVSYDLSYGPSTLLSDGVDGYIVPWGDRDQLADRLVRLLSEPEHAARLGRAGLDRVRARHSPAVVARTWESLFRSVARDARS